MNKVKSSQTFKDDQSELFYWIDKQDNELGSITRQEAHSGTKKIHRAVDTLLTNDKNQVLMQKRSKYKDTNPGYWATSASGHVTYGQSYEEAAIRETKEELGISLKDLTFLKEIFFESDLEKEIIKIYRANYQGEKIIADENEVEETRWVDIKNLKKFSQKNKLTSSSRYILQTVGWY